MERKKKLYKLNDDILFRTCSLYDGEKSGYGDCTNWSHTWKNNKDVYRCNQYGIHYHCAKHVTVELQFDYDKMDTLICPRCKKEIEVKSFAWLRSESLKLLNMNSSSFKNAELIRIDDFYINEIKTEPTKVSDYWVKTDVKTDKDGDTIIVIYVGKTGEKRKVQFFVKPEKLQLSSDHKDMDPATVLSKIEVTLKDRKLIQEYE